MEVFMSAGNTRITSFLLTAFISACSAAALNPSRLHNTQDRFPAPDPFTAIERKPVLDEEEFRAIIHQVVDPYQKLAALHNARIALRIPVDAEVPEDCVNAQDEDSILRCSWQSDFPNADAGRSRQNNTWYIGVGGGLARLPAMTAEGLTLVLCHEVGHLFAGFPFLREGFTGLALPVSVDGQSDYFAAQVCARKVWATDDNSVNAEGFRYEDMIEPTAVAQCNVSYSVQNERELCYKTVFAGMAFVKALGKSREEDPAPSVATPDRSEVGVTDNMHPAAQCRLDTFVAGALCPTVFDPAQNAAAVVYDETKIPGYELAAPGGEAARDLSMSLSCHEGFWPQAARPRCWFSPDQTEEGGWMNEL
jgi:hypothetical protein